MSKHAAPAQSLLTQTRKSRGLSLDQVASIVKTDPTNLSRVEKGTQTPKTELALALHSFYDGAVPLEAIYFPNGAPHACPMCNRAWNDKPPTRERRAAR